MCEEEEKKMRELYEQYKASRDSELDKFWKNSMYVWTFLGLCFTAYGVLIVKYVGCESNSFKLQLAIAVICAFGFLLSVIWTWMAQGLKAWYEVFENAVWDIESYHNVFKFPPNYTIGNYWSVNGSKTTKPYSPSALVVTIGWCMWVFWIAAFVFNIVIYYSDIFCSIGVIKETKDTIDSITIANLDCIPPKMQIHLDDISKTLNKIDTKNVIVYSIIFGVLSLILVGTDWVFLAKIRKNKIISSTLRTEKREKAYQDVKNMLINQNVRYKYIEVSKKDTIWIVFDKSAENNDGIKQVISKIKKAKESDFIVKDEYVDDNITSNNSNS